TDIGNFRFRIRRTGICYLIRSDFNRFAQLLRDLVDQRGLSAAPLGVEGENEIGILFEERTFGVGFIRIGIGRAADFGDDAGGFFGFEGERVVAALAQAAAADFGLVRRGRRLGSGFRSWLGRRSEFRSWLGWRSGFRLIARRWRGISCFA